MIVISGITSALGISLAKYLVSKGIPVIGFARRLDRVKEILSHPLIELRVADINDLPLISSFCVNATGVVHLAALSTPWGEYADFFRVNVEGTRTIVQAALQSKVKRFVHVSTPSIYFGYKDQFLIAEDGELPNRSVNAYATTKRLAEEAVDQAFLQGLPSVTLRPRAIFGPYDQTLFPRVINTCQDRGIPCFRKESPIIDITYLDNVTQALLLALEAPLACMGQKYNITNGEPVRLWEVLERLLSKLSIPVKRKRIPYSLAYATSWLLEIRGKLRGKEPHLTRYGVGVMSYSQTLSIEKAQKELNYHPLISVNEGIDRYVDWLQTQ